MSVEPPIKLEKKSKRKVKKIAPLSEISFLNLPEKPSMAYIAVKITGSLTGSEYQDNYEIKLSDCHNTILLHGNLKTPNSRKNGLHKIDVLISKLTEARDHIESELKKNRLKYK